MVFRRLRALPGIENAPLSLVLFSSNCIKALILSFSANFYFLAHGYSQWLLKNTYAFIQFQEESAVNHSTIINKLHQFFFSWDFCTYSYFQGNSKQQTMLVAKANYKIKRSYLSFLPSVLNNCLMPNNAPCALLPWLMLLHHTFPKRAVVFIIGLCRFL